MYFSPSVVGGVLAAVSSVNGHVVRQQHSGVVNATGPYVNSTVWTTQTVTAYQTYCPTSTTFTKGNKTYTATAQTWITVTDCPQLCTISNEAGAQPTVAPIGYTPVYNNATSTSKNIPVTSSCSCPKVNGTQPASSSSCSCPYSGSSGSNSSSGSSGSSGNSNTGSSSTTFSPLIVNAGEKMSASLSALVIVALGFFAL